MPDLIQANATSFATRLPRRHGSSRARHATSPLMLCDRLITLAQDADRAGLAVTAGHLVHLARGVFDDQRPRLLA